MKPLTLFYVLIVLAVLSVIGGIIFNVVLFALKVWVGLVFVASLYAMYKIHKS